MHHSGSPHYEAWHASISLDFGVIGDGSRVAFLVGKMRWVIESFVYIGSKRGDVRLSNCM